MKNTKKGLFLIIASGIAFGIMPSTVSYCYSQGANQLIFLLFRYLTLTAILFPIVARQKGAWTLLRRHLPKFFALAAAGNATSLLLFSAYKLIPTGVVTTVHFLYPSVVALLCVIVYHEKLSRRKLLCLVLCVVGMLLMLNTSGQTLNVTGLVITVASSFTWALYIVLLDKFDFGETTSLQIMFFVDLNGIVLSLLASLLTRSLNVSMPPVGWLALVASTLFMAVCGALFFTMGVRETDAQTSAIASTLEPITSLAIGALFLHEGITLLSAVGAGCILLAVVLNAVLHE